MKILQLIYSLGSGGAERFTVDLSNELVELGNEVTLCVLRDDAVDDNGFYKNEIHKSVEYINLKIPPGLKPSNIYRLFNLISKVKPDVVHCHLNLVNYIFPLTFIFARINFFSTVHSQAKNEVKSKLEFYIRRHFFSRQKVKAVTISKETSLSFSEFYGFESYREIINGRKPPELSSNLPAIIQKLKKPGNVVFLHVGRFHPVKNQEMLIDSFNLLSKDYNNIFLIIVGKGFDSKETEKLRNKAGSNIYFEGEQHNIADYFKSADAFCLTSLIEGMPITIIESLACGCIPICTPAGGIKNMIIHGKTGYLSDSYSETDYLKTLRHFLEHKNEIQKADLIGFFNINYHINICAKNYLKAYSEI